MRPTVDGVLMPDDMLNKPLEEQRAYAARVKKGNAKFVKAALDLEARIEQTFPPDEARRILDRG